MATPDTQQLLRTPLHSCHQQAGAKIVPFAGWEMPLDYGSILTEARAVRSGAGVFDVSHMARFWFRGPSAAAELDHALGGCVTDLPVGKARYSMLLQEDGGILDDLITYRTGDEAFFMVVNAANRSRDRDHLVSRLTDTAFEDITEDGGGILALQGPDSVKVLQQLTGIDDLQPGFLDLAWPSSPYGELFIARTGYTGEMGFEIFVTAEQAEPVWKRLMELGVHPIGLGARDVLRLEAGLALYGHEIHEQVNPFDAGLRFAVRGWKTREFIGDDALRNAPEPTRELVGFTAEKRVPREGYPVLCDGVEVGVVCSGIYSATLDKPIATAYINKGVEGEFTVSARGKEFPVQRTDVPFVSHRSRG
jgi:aminomethyltransferase